jgi:hypothetical protein
VALATTLDQHPTPLLILGNQLTGSAARRQLSDLVKEMLATTTESEELDGLRRLKASVGDANRAQLRQAAIDVLTYTSRSVLLPETLRRAIPAGVADPDLFGRLLDAWGELTGARRWRLVELAEDLRTASQIALQNNPDPTEGTV